MNKLDALAQKLNLTPTAMFERIAADDRLLRTIEDRLTTVQRIEAAPSWPQLEPPERRTDLVATLTLQPGVVYVRTPDYCEPVVGLVKRLVGTEWVSPYWMWRLTQRQLPTHDRYVELAHRLLHAGVPVCVDPAYVERIRSGDWQPAVAKQVALITSGKHDGWFALWWDKTAGHYWTQARRLPGSHYDRPYVVVPPHYAAEVADFVAAHGFDVTPAAQAALVRGEEAIVRLLGLAPLPEQETDDDPDARPILPAEETEIDDELRDEPL